MPHKIFNFDYRPNLLPVRQSVAVGVGENGVCPRVNLVAVGHPVAVRVGDRGVCPRRPRLVCVGKPVAVRIVLRRKAEERRLTHRISGEKAERNVDNCI